MAVLIYFFNRIKKFAHKYSESYKFRKLKDTHFDIIDDKSSYIDYYKFHEKLDNYRMSSF